jgi:hypothetical protein
MGGGPWRCLFFAEVSDVRVHQMDRDHLRTSMRVPPRLRCEHSLVFGPVGDINRLRRAHVCPQSLRVRASFLLTPKCWACSGLHPWACGRLLPVEHWCLTLVTAPFAERLYWLATRQDGTVTRLDAEGNIAPVSGSDLIEAGKRIAGDVEIAEQALIGAEDAYYFKQRGASSCQSTG